MRFYFLTRLSKDLTCFMRRLPLQKLIQKLFCLVHVHVEPGGPKELAPGLSMTAEMFLVSELCKVESIS